MCESNIVVPFPHIVVNEKNEVLYFNEFFEYEFAVRDAQNIKVSDMVESFNCKIREQKAIIRQKCYRIFSICRANKNYDVYFIQNGCDNSCEIASTAVGIILVDNLDEMLDEIEEEKHSLILAFIERKINKLATDIGGIAKKTERDKYIFVFSVDKLSHLKEEKFPILESVKKTDMCKIPPTISIGIGINGESLAECMRRAHEAVDLALGRGGDQVVINDRGKFSFFGGHSKELSPNVKVRVRVKADSLAELISNATNVIVMGHKNPDFDCLGASVGMVAVCHSMKKECNIVMNEVTSSISVLYERIIKQPNYQNTFVTGQEAVNLVKPNTLLIVVDTHRKVICEEPELLDLIKNRVVFDHHRMGSDFIDRVVLSYHAPYASSTCELVTEMLVYMASRSVKISYTEADALLAGITVDTKNFTFKTNARTFEAAAYLNENGADTIRVKELFKHEMEDYTIKSKTVISAEKFNGNILIAKLTEEVENPILTAAQAADDLLGISDIDAGFVLCSVGDAVSISARSLGGINVQIIMESLGGGGHQCVSAAQLKETTLDEAEERLKKAILENVE